MAISSIRSRSNSSDIYQLYSKLSSGKRIRSAADDAAGLAISKKMEAQSTGYQTENRNITDSQSLLETTGGGLSSVTDSLKRMKELALQSSNGIYSDSDKAAMQTEIDQLKDQIDQVSQNTDFNGNRTLAGDALRLIGGTGELSYDVSADSLGISDFDITGSFDIRSLDKAMNTVSSMQGSVGGETNAMTHAVNSNSNADINLRSAQSMIESADMERVIMELKQKQLLDQSGNLAQKKNMNFMENNSLGAMGLY